MQELVPFSKYLIFKKAERSCRSRHVGSRGRRPPATPGSTSHVGCVVIRISGVAVQCRV